MRRPDGEANPYNDPLLGIMRFSVQVRPRTYDVQFFGEPKANGHLPLLSSWPGRAQGSLLDPEVIPLNIHHQLNWTTTSGGMNVNFLDDGIGTNGGIYKFGGIHAPGIGDFPEPPNNPSGVVHDLGNGVHVVFSTQGGNQIPVQFLRLSVASDAEVGTKGMIAVTLLHLSVPRERELWNVYYHVTGPVGDFPTHSLLSVDYKGMSVRSNGSRGDLVFGAFGTPYAEFSHGDEVSVVSGYYERAAAQGFELVVEADTDGSDFSSNARVYFRIPESNPLNESEGFERVLRGLFEITVRRADGNVDYVTFDADYTVRLQGNPTAAADVRTAIENEDVAALRTAVDSALQVSDWDVADNNGRRPLHRAILVAQNSIRADVQGRVADSQRYAGELTVTVVGDVAAEMVSILAAAGADPNVRGRYQGLSGNQDYTALQLAAFALPFEESFRYQGYVFPSAREIIRHLMDAGADPTLDGNFALDWLANQASYGTFDMMEEMMTPGPGRILPGAQVSGGTRLGFGAPSQSQILLRLYGQTRSTSQNVRHWGNGAGASSTNWIGSANDQSRRNRVYCVALGLWSLHPDPVQACAGVHHINSNTPVLNDTRMCLRARMESHWNDAARSGEPYGDCVFAGE